MNPRKQFLAAIRRDLGQAKSLLLQARTANAVERFFLPAEDAIQARIADLTAILAQAKTIEPKPVLVDYDRHGNSYSSVRTAYRYELGGYSSSLFGTWGI